MIYSYMISGSFHKTYPSFDSSSKLSVEYEENIPSLLWFSMQTWQRPYFHFSLNTMMRSQSGDNFLYLLIALIDWISLEDY